MALIRDPSDLPTFEYTRSRARECLGDAADWLRSDWCPGGGPTDEQGAAKVEAMRYIALAKAALDRAAPS